MKVSETPSGEKTLVSFNVADKVAKDSGFSCSKLGLTSLEGAPKEVQGTFWCVSNDLTSLKWCTPKIFGNLHCTDNKLTSLASIHKLFKDGYIKGSIVIGGNPIKSHLLGLLLIPELKFVRAYFNDEYYEAIEIINKHLRGNRDIIECQQELIDAGYKQYAQL